MNPFLIKSNYTSPNLYKEIARLAESQIAQIAEGIRWTLEKAPDATLIGGVAVAHYLKGGRPLTPDIDFMTRDIAGILACLDEEAIGYKPLRSGHGNILGITVNKFNADYLDANAGCLKLNAMIVNRAQPIKIGGLSVRIINPELLTIMKLDLGRGKDIQDGFALLASGALDKSKYIKYLNALRNDIEDYGSLLGYSEMI